MGRKPRSRAVVIARSDQELEALLARHLAEPDETFEAVGDMSAHDPEQCWRFLTIAMRSGLSDAQLAALSAGPFEDMMKRHGDDFIARVEAEARQDPGMRVLVATVWRAGMRDGLWARIVALRGELGIAAV